MSAAVVTRMRAQVPAKTSGLEAATVDVDGALTVEACAMYSQQLSAFRQLAAIAAKAILAEHSHNRRALELELQHVRALAGMLAEKVYRIAGESPRSRFSHVRDAQDALLVEVTEFQWPPKSST